MLLRLACMVLLLSVASVAQAPAQRALEPEPIASRHFTTSDSVRLHYLEAGDGPPIVLIPGWTMPAWLWQPQLEGLAPHYRVIAFDPRGQGASEKAPEGNYPERRVQDLHELIAHLKLEQVTLVGWSLGTPEILTYVDQYGTAGLRALVMVDGQYGPFEDPKMNQGVRQLMRQMQRNRKEFTARFMRTMFRQPQPPELMARLEQDVLAVPTCIAELVRYNYFEVGDWRPMLAKVDVPLLFVYAAAHLRPQATALLQRTPPVQVEHFEGSGHALFVDAPEKFNDLLLRFLSPKPQGDQ